MLWQYKYYIKVSLLQKAQVGYKSYQEPLKLTPTSGIKHVQTPHGSRVQKKPQKPNPNKHESQHERQTNKQKRKK